VPISNRFLNYMPILNIYFKIKCQCFAMINSRFENGCLQILNLLLRLKFATCPFFKNLTKIIQFMPKPPIYYGIRLSLNYNIDYLSASCKMMALVLNNIIVSKIMTTKFQKASLFTSLLQLEWEYCWFFSLLAMFLSVN
jgi:hypothetical protein